MEIHPSPVSASRPVHLLRSLAAQLYDALLVIALLMAATALAVGLLSLTGGSEQFAEGNPLVGNLGFKLYLLLVIGSFFIGFWRHGGQTLGMRAWQFKVCGQDGSPPSYAQVTLRFAAALLSWGCLGLGQLWMLVDPQGLSWHDRLSGTRLEHHQRH